jgi:glutamyl-tRNA synthetase
MTERKTRVRFAPSPTGPLHIGGVRTALYNYLYAKQKGGDFVLRIEDTDSQRFVPGAEKYIIDSLRWCGIFPDEGVNEDGTIAEKPSERHPYAPYRQSQRRSIYRKYAEELVERGFAYYAFDTPEELASLRKEKESNGETFTYNYATRSLLRNSLTLPEAECNKIIENEKDWTIRFKIPENKVVKMHDLIRGDIEVNTNTLDDKVLWKASDELPTYHLANIVDDHLMEITQVIRGEEWLPSLPLHYLLYEAFGWENTQPEFAHLSLLLKPDGKGKLSKRDGDRLGFPVFPLRWTSPEGEISRGYREDGYFPQAFVNIIALLGWNPGTEQEIFSLDELVNTFSLDRVVRSGAKFNPEKAKWFNHEYLQKEDCRYLAQEFDKVLVDKGIHCDIQYVEKVCCLMKNRASFLTDFWELSHYFFVAPVSYDSASAAKFFIPENKERLSKVKELITSAEPFTKESIEEKLHNYIVENQWPMGKVMNGLRLALVGTSNGPGVADIISIIGKKDFSQRVERAICNIQA